MAKSKKVKKNNLEKIELVAKTRNIFGKKLSQLRKVGIIPANIFGADFKSQAISIGVKDFINAYKIVKETGVIYIKLDKEEIPTLIRNVQKHPVNDSYLHIDFRKVDLKKKVTAEVPIKTVGVSEAVAQKGGVFLTMTQSLIVEALPQDIPQFIEVDITALKDIGNEIKVADLKKSDKYQIKDDAAKVIVSVVEHKEESITPETTVAVTPEVITESAKPEEGVPAATVTETKTQPEATKTKEKT